MLDMTLPSNHASLPETTGHPDVERGRGPWRTPVRLGAGLGLLVAVGIAYAAGLHDYLTLETLRDHRADLALWVADHQVAAAAAFMAIYFVAVALSLPGGLFLTIAGGFLFGVVLGTLYVVIGASLGATALFLLARFVAGDHLADRVGPWVRRMEAGFRENALSYMLVLRLVPIFPFWLVNLVPAFLGVSTATYVLTTVVGIIPGALVYASVGNGLGAVFAAGKDPDLGLILEPQVIGPILGLAALAMIPVIYKRLQRRA